MTSPPFRLPSAGQTAVSMLSKADSSFLQIFDHGDEVTHRSPKTVESVLRLVKTCRLKAGQTGIRQVGFDSVKTLSSLSDVPRMAYDWRMGGDRHIR